MARAFLFFIVSLFCGAALTLDPFAHQAAQVRASFRAGEVGLAKGQTIFDVCGDFLDQQRVFCVEGYFNQWADQAVTNPRFDPIQVLEKAEHELGRDQRFLLSVWAVAFGISASEHGLPITALATSLAHKDPWIFSYVVDGWALTAQNRLGAEQALKACADQIDARFARACRWGVGRSLFFYTNPQKARLLKNAEIQAGYEFASHFTRNSRLPIKAVAQLKRSARQIAELGKNAFIQEPTHQPELKSLAECLSQHHAAECAQP